jgi:hypothetical protein
MESPDVGAHLITVLSIFLFLFLFLFTREDDGSLKPFTVGLIVLGTVYNLVIYTLKSFVDKQKTLYSLHCQYIFPFHEHLTEKEQDYIRQCIRLSDTEMFRFWYARKDPLLHRISSFTYSHEVKGNQVNSGRIAYGLATRPDKIQIYAQDVLNERNIQMPLESENIRLSGLGWDFGNKTFRVYSRYDDFKKLPRVYQRLAPVGDFLPMGIVAWTYNQNNELIETKVYRYPPEPPKTEGSRYLTVLSSDKRMRVDQYDCTPKQKNWKENVNEAGKRIIEMYERCGYELDTVAFKDRDHFTLYFPMMC